MPTCSSTCKCLLIACRVRRDPCVSWEIECDDPSSNVPSKERRVASPRAAKIEARSSSSIGLDMMRDVLALLAPARIVHAVGLEAALLGDGGEAGFGDDEQTAGAVGLQPEFDQRGRLLAIVARGIDGVGMPGEGEQALRLHALYRHLPGHVLIAGMDDLAACH